MMKCVLLVLRQRDGLGTHMYVTSSYKIILGGGSRIGQGRLRSYFEPPGAVGGR